ncbi:Uncharacterized membrane protein YcaP, DUF421 family [Paenibacillus polysaccharolyticus]|uniref:Uncharacterized membrane protein YcaP, DUF421 family n=1 Tax=Paenibacillus polysaccharolyticus TaxID=582692 RepID=A0A1G5D2F7_9BACL|nr:DUF421 domain-containing protein [Paenibacillus polysaccharolyticus]SCY08717.1 Uncharacterized membrane protein YcaP, DUF421 family [Paenibacillus polysaccharolyticus]
MELAKDLLLVTGRIVTIFPLLLVMGLVMGRRSIGELPVFDFLVVLALGAVVGADIADPEIEHIPTGYAIIFIGLMQRIVSLLVIKYKTFGKWITFKPTVVISNGNLIVSNLHQVRYSIDNILQMLREKDIFHMEEVELAILEANGRLTVHKSPLKASVTVEDLGLTKTDQSIAYPLILEGNVSKRVLEYVNKDEAWLDEQLIARGLQSEDIFYASIDENLKLHISQPTLDTIPPIEH